MSNPSENIPREQIVDYILQLFRERGESTYAGEPVTQTEHGLQAAWQAEKQKGDSATIAAALMHDIGHLLHELGEDCAEEGIDDQHEESGAQWLSGWFGPEVTEPIRLHVPAKRYRCAVDPKYFQALSPASVLSLKLQGGPFTPEQVAEFDQHPYAQQALQLRLWDEIAKVEGLETPPLEHYRPYLEDALAE